MVELGESQENGANNLSHQAENPPNNEEENAGENNDDIEADEVVTADVDMDWGWAGIFPLEEATCNNEVFNTFHFHTIVRYKGK